MWPQKVKKIFNGTENLKVGDCVLAKYHYNGNFTELDEMTNMEQFDNCPICWYNLEANSNGCTENRLPRLAIIDEGGAKVRIADIMQLKSKEFKNIDIHLGTGFYFCLKMVVKNLLQR